MDMYECVVCGCKYSSPVGKRVCEYMHGMEFKIISFRKSKNGTTPQAVKVKTPDGSECWYVKASS